MTAMPTEPLDDDFDDGLDDDFFDETDEEDGAEWSLEPVEWWAVLAPEGTSSGDGRSFSPEALSWRDLPLPLRWQRADTGGHDGAVVVGTIRDVWRDNGMVYGSGWFLDSEEADEVVGHIAEGAVRGISVDVDDAELAVADEDHVEFGKGRICAGTIVAIPAFPEAEMHLGPAPDRGAISEEPVMAAGIVFKDYSPEQRRKMADDGRALPDGSFPIADCEDLHNAVQAIGRAGDPPAAKAHIKKRASALKCEGFELPEGWSADTEDFARGPGWVTNPKETRRLHSYWTQPNHKGYAKIRWGTPGDFTRLRRALSKYISPQFLNRVAAQWHFDALGYWPGECGWPGNPPCGARRGHHTADSVVLAAATVKDPYPAQWFANPLLDGPTPLTIDGQHIYGHLALFDSCHIGFKDVCTVPPNSHAEYAYFTTGAVHTTDGLIAVGHITMGTGHASLSSSPRETASHYDNTGFVVADVKAGEDEFGIWFSGALRDGLDDKQIHALQAAPLSGDWRNIGGNLELIAALAVNAPGFVVPRPALAASGGVQTSLVAAGVVPRGQWFDVKEIAEEVEKHFDRKARAKAALNAVNAERVAAATASMR